MSEIASFQKKEKKTQNTIRTFELVSLPLFGIVFANPRQAPAVAFDDSALVDHHYEGGCERKG